MSYLRELYRLLFCRDIEPGTKYRLDWDKVNVVVTVVKIDRGRIVYAYGISGAVVCARKNHFLRMYAKAE